MVKLSKKSLIWVLVALLALAAGFCLYWFILRGSKSSDSNGKGVTKLVNTDGTQTKQAIDQVDSSYNSFDDINKIFNDKDYLKGVPAAKSYADDTKNDPTLRLNMYKLCIYGALQTKQDSTKTQCYESGKVVANGLSDATKKQDWLMILDDYTNGTSNYTQKVSNENQ